METTWLAEMTDQSHRYAVAAAGGLPAHLTSDPLEATRFPTRKACEDFCWIGYIRTFVGELRPTEHVFMDRPTGDLPKKMED